MFEKIILGLILSSKFLFVISWKPTANYCKVECRPPRDVEHTACNCAIIPPRKMIHDQIKNFRQDMVDAHNECRNKIASGGEKDKGYSEAANMMAVSYDLELEHIARCYAGKYKGDNVHDKCRKMASLDSSPGQNLAGTKLGSIPPRVLVRQFWYDELNYVIKNKRADFINAFDSSYKEGDISIGHFSVVIWWSITLLGCAYVHNNDSVTPGYTFALICNYGGQLNFSDSPNLRKKPIYKVGPKCSACPGNTRCNAKSKYPALCGYVAEDKEPLEKPKPSRTVRIYENKLLLVFVLSGLIAVGI